MKSKLQKKSIPAQLRLLAVFFAILGFQITLASSIDHPRTEQPRISLTLRNATLVEIMNAIEKKTDLVFVYSQAVTIDKQKFSVDMRNATVAEILTATIVKKGYAFKQIGSTITITKDTPTNDKPKRESHRSDTVQFLLKGMIRDEKTGDPVVGATVTIAETSSGTLTDADGRFTLRVFKGALLKISFVGYVTKTFLVSEHLTEAEIFLTEDVQQLSEVVVTALGIDKEVNKLGYSVQEVSGDDFSKTREPNVLGSLTGRVAGLTVYNKTGLLESPEFTLRGNSPLIVVNGIPTSSDFWDVNPDDIENISVLKGPSASALYGSRAKNGVVMITLKSGKSAKRFRINVNSNTLLQVGYTAIPEVQHEFGNGENGMYSYVDGAGGGVFDGDFVWGPKLDVKDSDTNSGYVERVQYNSPIDPDTGDRIAIPWISRGRNNLEDFLRTGLITSNTISVAASDEKSDVRVAFSQMHQTGQVPNTQMDISTFSLSGGAFVGNSNRLRIDGSLTYNNQFSDNYPTRGYGSQNYLYNTIIWMGDDVSVNDLTDYWQSGKEGLQQYNFNYVWYNNPWFMVNESLQGHDKNVYYGRSSISYEITPELQFMARGGLNYYTYTHTQTYPKSYIGSDSENGNYEISTATYLKFEPDALFTYKKKLLDNLNLNGTLGANFFTQRSRTLSSETDGLNIPGVYNLSNSKGNVISSDYLSRKRMYGVYGSVDLNYEDFLSLGFTGRNDWSSAMPASKNSYFYPSVSLAGVISNVVELPDMISLLKLRTSWAQVSSDLSIYSISSTYSAQTIWNGNASLAYPSTLVNSQIEPETSNSLEYGVDMGLLSDRIALSVTHYHTKDFNDIVDVPMSLASGFTSRTENANEYLRKGWEVSLSARAISTNNLTWDIQGNWNRHRRILEDFHENYGSSYNGVNIGERMDLVKGSAWLRDSDGNIIHDESTGLPIEDSYSRALGYQDADWTFGLFNTITYKRFSLAFNIDGRIGGLINSKTNFKLWEGGKHPDSANEYREADYLGEATFLSPGVIVTGGTVSYDDQGNIVSDTRTYTENTVTVGYRDWVKTFHNIDEYKWFDATFVKLREVSVTYQLPPTLLNALKLSNGTVSLTGRNLLLWTDIPFVDPDTNEDNLQDPSAKYMGVNFNLTF